MRPITETMSQKEVLAALRELQILLSALTVTVSGLTAGLDGTDGTDGTDGADGADADETLLLSTAETVERLERGYLLLLKRYITLLRDVPPGLESDVPRALAAA